MKRQLGRTRSMVFGEVELDGEKVTLEIGRFVESPHCLLLMAWSPDGTPYSRLTVNVDLFPPLPDAGLIMKVTDWGKRWGKVAGQLVETGWFEDTGIEIGSGHVEYPVWKLTEVGILKLLLLDPTFVDELLPETVARLQQLRSSLSPEDFSADALALLYLAHAPHVGEA